MTRERTMCVVAITTALWFMVAGATAGPPGSEYRSQEFGFALRPPHGWMAYDQSSPQVQTLLAAARSATTSRGSEMGQGLVVIFSEFPFEDSAPFNTNVTISVQPLHDNVLSDAALRQAAVALLSDLAPQQSCSKPQEIRFATTWFQSDCHYGQATKQRQVPIQARPAMAADPRRRQCILVTASALEREFARYETFFAQTLASFRWTDHETTEDD